MTFNRPMPTKGRRGLHYWLLALLLISMSIPTFLQAQTDDGGLRLTTSPLPISLKVKPGQSVTTDLRIRNSGNQPETLTVGLLAFSADGDGGGPKLRQRQPGDDYFDWVSFSDKEFRLAPNQWHTTRMTIKVPPEAAFGYYYAATFSRVGSNPADLGQEQAVLIGATATLVLLEVDSPHAKRQLSIDSFSADRSWYEFLPVNFRLMLNNTGNVHSIINGDIFISRSGSQEVISTLKVNQLQGNILPQSKRAFTNSWTDGFPLYSQPPIQDNQTPQPQLQWDFSQADTLRFGKYTARAVLAYDDGHRDIPLEASVDFWVIPWRIILAGLVVGGLSCFGLFALGRSLWRLIRRPSPDSL